MAEAAVGVREKITFEESNKLEHIVGRPEYVTKRGFLEPLDENRFYALEKKYLLRGEDGEVAEFPGEAMYRMASSVAGVERGYGASEEEVEKLTEEFYTMFAEEEFSPAGRPWTNAGTDIGALFNCYVLPIEDDLGSIFESVRNAALIHKEGGGTGYNFSKIRPRGTYVKKSQGVASGPVSFMTVFDAETKTINSGNRRGANMGILNVDHPDILDFIYCKANEGEIKNFNISLGATDEFMEAVKNDGFYSLSFGGEELSYQNLESMIRNVEENKLGGSDVGETPNPNSLRLEDGEVLPGITRVIDSYTGEFAGRVSQEGNIELSGKYVMGVVSKLTWENGDPGMIFLDRINENNPLPNKGPIDATNPCGEQPLHPYDACNLGSIPLPSFLRETSNGSIDWDYERLGPVVDKATRFGDNINDLSKGPIPEIERTTKAHRRTGIGVMGFADALVRMGHSYASEIGRRKGEEVMSFITERAKKASHELAMEKGVFSSFEGSVYDTGREEDKVRNIQRTTIAPTGTIAMLYGVSSGIEPLFAIGYRKNIRGGDSLFYLNQDFEGMCRERGLDVENIRELVENNNGSAQGISEVPKDIQELFKCSMDLNYKEHILVQAAFQGRQTKDRDFTTDNAVSKTINMDESVTPEEIEEAYVFAYEQGLKGTTIYRNNSKDVQVLETGGNGKLEKISMENPVKPSEIMPAVRIRQQTHLGNMHVSVVVDPRREYAPLEVFGNLGDSGEQEAATMEGLGRLTSLWLRNGGTIDEVIEQCGDIGSGRGVTTRDGGIRSLEMGFARALSKYDVAKGLGRVEDLMLGKMDYDEFGGEVSDILRKKGKSWKQSLNKNEGESSLKENKGESKKGVPKKNKKKSSADKCPECKSPLRMEEGCMKCTCGFSKC